LLSTPSSAIIRVQMMLTTTELSTTGTKNTLRRAL